LLLGFTTLVVGAAEEVLLLLLEGLLDEVAKTELSEGREQVGLLLSIDPSEKRACSICSRTITDGGTFLIGLGLLCWLVWSPTIMDAQAASRLQGV
jgi:hypothetical protein